MRPPASGQAGTLEVKAALALARRMRRPAPLFGALMGGAWAVSRPLPGEEPAVDALLAGPDASVAVLAALLAHVAEPQPERLAGRGVRRAAPPRPAPATASGADRTAATRAVPGRALPLGSVAPGPRPLAPPLPRPGGAAASAGAAADIPPRRVTSVAGARDALRRALAGEPPASGRDARRSAGASPAAAALPASGRDSGHVMEHQGANGPLASFLSGPTVPRRALEVLVRGTEDASTGLAGPIAAADIARAQPQSPAARLVEAERAAETHPAMPAGAGRADVSRLASGATGRGAASASASGAAGMAAAPAASATAATEFLPRPARARPSLARLDDRDTALAEAAWRHGVEAP